MTPGCPKPRTGSFEYFRAQNDTASLRTLAHYVIERHFPKAEFVDNTFNAAFVAGFRRKLGLLEEDESDTKLMEKTISALVEGDVDFTLFFRHLTRIAQGEEDHLLLDLFSSPDTGEDWLGVWRQRIAQEDTPTDIRGGVMQGYAL